MNEGERWKGFSGLANSKRKEKEINATDRAVASGVEERGGGREGKDRGNSDVWLDNATKEGKIDRRAMKGEKGKRKEGEEEEREKRKGCW